MQAEAAQRGGTDPDGDVAAPAPAERGIGPAGVVAADVLLVNG